MIYPPNIIRRGDRVACNKWLGYAQEKLRLLEASMTDWIKQDSVIYRPQPGVLVKCVKLIGLSYIIIEVYEAAGEGKKKIVPTVENLRFFCRVGSPDALDVDGVDETRYYWIDFGALSGEDTITLYVPGKEVIEDTFGNTYTIPALNKNIFKMVVDLPTDINHTQTKAFNLSAVDSEGETVTRRFVAGYHYLVGHLDSGSRDLMALDRSTMSEEFSNAYPDAINLSQAACDDETGTNRFYANIDESMLAWYRVLQEWPADELTLTEADSQVKGYLNRIGYDKVTKKWGLYNSFVSFDVSPLNVISATTHINRTPVREETCLFADIYELTPSSFKLNVTLKHRPLLYNALTGGIEYPDKLYNWEFTADGFSQRLAMTYDYGDGGGYWKEYTSWEYVYGNLCSDHTSSSDCSANASFQQRQYRYRWQNWSVATNATTITVMPYHGSYTFFTGSRSEDYRTYIEEDLSVCTWYAGSGTCAGTSPGHNCDPFRTSYWVLIGTGTDRFYGNTFGNNIHFGDKNIDSYSWTFNNRNLGCNDDVLIAAHATCSGAGSAVNDYADWGLWASKLTSNPNHCDNGTPSSTHNLTKAQWPSNNQEISDSLGCPSPISSLSAVWNGGAGAYAWEANDNGASDTSTTQIDSFIVDDDLTYSESGTGSVRYLDDRTTEGTHGLVIAVKGNTIGTWEAITHGEDGITVVTKNKFNDLVTALLESGLMYDTDVIHDIGLV